MNYTVSALSICFIIFAMFVGVLIPVGLFLYFRAKKKADISPFFIGCAVFIVFALVLENLVKYGLMKTSAWTPIQNNVWLLGIVMGLFAGVFEETGRYLAFRTVLRKKQVKDVNALMYGAGHGGFEVFMILVLAMTSNLVFALLIKTGTYDAFLSSIPETSRSVYETAFQTISNTAPYMFLVGILERFAAITLHLSLSVFVWFAAKNKRVFWMFPVAVILHTLVDACAVIVAKLSTTFVTESFVVLFSGLCAILALGIWRKYAVAYVPAAVTPETAYKTIDAVYTENDVAATTEALKEPDAINEPDESDN